MLSHGIDPVSERHPAVGYNPAQCGSQSLRRRVHCKLECRTLKRLPETEVTEVAMPTATDLRSAHDALPGTRHIAGLLVLALDSYDFLLQEEPSLVPLIVT